MDNTGKGQVLQEFKQIVNDLQQSDTVLMRYLVARDFDLENSEKMLRNAVQVRKDLDMHNCHTWIFPKHYSTDLPYRYFGMDYEGAPICWGFGGRWKLKALLDNGEDFNEMFRWILLMIEKGLQKTFEFGSPGNVVFDLEGLSYAQCVHLQSLKLFYRGFEKLEELYPEMIKFIYVINTPWAFQLLLNFVKGAISQNTLAKTRFFGSNKDEWVPVLLDKFPRESFPSEVDIIY